MCQDSSDLVSWNRFSLFPKTKEKSAKQKPEHGYLPQKIKRVLVLQPNEVALKVKGVLAPILEKETLLWRKNSLK